MTDNELLELCRAQLRECVMWESDEHAQDFKAAWDYYFQRLRGDEIPGRSTAVAGDMSASVEANLAQMVDALSTENLAEFDPNGEDDEDQAGLESDVVAYYIMKQQNGFIELATAIKNALAVRNGIVKVWVETFEETATRTYDNVAPEVHMLVAPDAELVDYDEDQSQLTVRGKVTHKRFCARCVANENFHFPKTWDRPDFQECPAVFERHESTRSEMIRLGFKKSEVARLTPVATYGHSPAATTLNVRQVAPRTNARLNDPSLETIEWFEGYMLVDVDGDGIAERRRVCFHYDDGVVLLDEPEELVLYGIGSVLLTPNRAVGISQFDKLRQTQDEHTGLKRALYDNVNTVTKNRTVSLDGAVNGDDLADGRSNGNIRVRKGGSDGVEDVRSAVMALQIPDNSGSILQNIDALKRERAELGGAALDLASAQAQVGGPNARLGSQGLDRAYSAMEQLAALMTKTIAETLIRSVWLLAHAVIRREFTQPVSVRRSNGWQTTTPAQWQARRSVTVRVGMSPGERARQAATLENLLNKQITLARDLGMEDVLVSAPKFYRTMMTWLRVSDVRNPEAYMVDPSSPDAQRAMQQKQQAAQQESQQRKSLMDRAIGTRETEIALDKYKHDSSLQHSYWSDVLDSDVEEAKIVGKATTDLLLARESVPKLTAGERPKAER
jgi:hypothetical protein